MSRVLWVPLFLVGSVAAAPAEEKEKEGIPNDWLESPEMLLDMVAAALTQHYELDDDQSGYAKELLSEYGRKFLKARAEDLAGVQADFLKLQFGNNSDDGMTLEFAKRLKTLTTAGRDTLDRFSKEFRTILTDDQRARFDVEHKQVELLLQVAELEADKRISQEQRGGGRDADDIGKAGRRFTGAGFLEQNWEMYKQLFAEHYGLDAEQTRKADEMLAVAKRNAAEYRKAGEEGIRRFAAAYAKLKEAASEKGLGTDAKLRLAAERKALDGEADKFEAPLRAIFENLKSGLDSLLTPDQKTKHRPFPLRNVRG